MWSPEKVEIALFTWGKWRWSIISQWLDPEEDLGELTLKQLRDKVGRELLKLKLPTSIWLEIYWICCVVSEYSFNHWNTYNSIIVPDWLLLRYDSIMGFSKWPYYRRRPIRRVYPPEIWDEDDVDYVTRRAAGTPNYDKSKRIYPGELWDSMFLSSHHELYGVLNKFKGRPRRRSRNPGRRPSYSDRLAVNCARLKDKFKMTYVEIATRFGLRITKPIFSQQSDIARHLVYRGRKLIAETKESL